MAIQVAAGTFYTQYSASTIQSICDGIKGALLTSGWSVTNTNGTATFTFSGLPSNGQTITVGSIVYTWKTVINNANPNELNIPGTATQAALNLAEAIVAGAGGGTDYSSATTANPLATATASLTVTFVTSVASGFSGAPLAVANGSTNVTLAGAFNGLASGQGYAVTSATTPQGLNLVVFLDNSGGTNARVRIGSIDGTVLSADNTAQPGAAGAAFIKPGARTQEIACCAYQFFTWVLADATSSGFFAAAGVPFIRPYHQASVITGATNASPIVITQVGHGLSTGQDVFIVGVQGNTAANGFFTVTVVDADHYSLNGSTGNGGYTAGSGLVANTSKWQIAQCMWLMGTDSSDIVATLRSSLFPSGPVWFGCVNQYSWGANLTAVSCTIKIPKHPSSSIPGTGLILNFGMISDLFEPFICWPLTNVNSIFLSYGQLWSAFITEEPLPMDRLKLGFVIGVTPHDCVNLTDGTQEPHGSLWLLKN